MLSPTRPGLIDPCRTRVVVGAMALFSRDFGDLGNSDRNRHGLAPI